ncbi:hypothetical protein [Neokomagataea anthophila]|uniref:Uncharacterized protein n=1 Tax=Neokomagataea anthophila TaxID=2826925 RepID=A0ABS5E5N8_9PROT|nr:hypothetical protein [Neokomagataea anthophila]MBR0558848.1 hypothetical protein [Neokomagataea anthophila]
MISTTLTHLIGLPTCLISEIAMVAFVPLIGLLMLATLASDRLQGS